MLLANIAATIKRIVHCLATGVMVREGMTSCSQHKYWDYKPGFGP